MILKANYRQTEFGEIPSDWKKTALGKLFKIKHGYAFKSKYFSEVETSDILLTPGNVSVGGGFSHDKYKYFDGNVPKDYILRAGDIFVNMTDLSKDSDTLGYSAKVPSVEGKVFLHNQRLGLIYSLSKFVDKEFIYWKLHDPSYRFQVLGSATGTTVKHTSPSKIYEVMVGLPKLREQENIANILSSLEKKIDLNRKTNYILKEIQKELYSHWFINFEFPNEQRAPYKSSGGKMIDSKFGKIPMNWSVLSLDKIASKIIDYRGKTPKKLGSDWTAFGIPALSAKNIKNNKIINRDSIRYVDFETYRIWMTVELKKNDILLTSEAPLGQTYLLPDDTRYCLSQRLFAVRSNPSILKPLLLYQFLNSVKGQYELTRRATGSVVTGIRQSELKKVHVLVPEKKVQNDYFTKIKEIETYIDNNVNQINHLTQIKDLLLPRLMSGKIRVKS